MVAAQAAALVQTLVFHSAVLVAQGRIGLQPQAARLALVVAVVALPLVLLLLSVALAVLMAAVLVVAAQALLLPLLVVTALLCSPTTQRLQLLHLTLH